MSTLITRTAFNALDNNAKVSYVTTNGAEFAPEVVTNQVPASAAVDSLFAPEAAPAPTAPASVTAETAFEIEGDAVYLNVSLKFPDGTVLRTQGFKLTEKRNCMRSWDKEAKCFTEEHSDTMSIIDMCRNYGASFVNQHILADVRLGMAGEKHTAKVDPLAALAAATKS